MKGSGSGPFFLDDLIFSFCDSEFFLNVEPLTLLPELEIGELHLSSSVVKGCLNSQSSDLCTGRFGSAG